MIRGMFLICEIDCVIQNTPRSFDSNRYKLFPFCTINKVYNTISL